MQQMKIWLVIQFLSRKKFHATCKQKVVLQSSSMKLGPSVKKHYNDVNKITLRVIKQQFRVVFELNIYNYFNIWIYRPLEAWGIPLSIPNANIKRINNFLIIKSK